MSDFERARFHAANYAPSFEAHLGYVKFIALVTIAGGLLSVMTS